MKKFTTLFLAAAFVSATCGAKILRVSNLAGTSAPYQTLTEAVVAAADGDTIMLEGSSKAYEAATISKKLVIKGPGYWLVENGITQNGDTGATIKNTLAIEAEGVKLEGLVINEQLKIKASHVTVMRCFLYQGISIYSTVTHPVISQNYIRIGIGGGSSYKETNCTYALITNNIFGSCMPAISSFDKSTIMYNTMTSFDGDALYDVTQSVFTNNFMKNESGKSLCSGLTYADNVYWEDATAAHLNFNDCSSDTAIHNRQNEISGQAGFPDNVGAWAGDAPYVISGVPVGPVIESVKVPVSVEQGKQLPVTVTLKVQQ